MTDIEVDGLTFKFVGNMSRHAFLLTHRQIVAEFKAQHGQEGTPVLPRLHPIHQEDTTVLVYRYDPPAESA